MDNPKDTPSDDQTPQAKVLSITERIEQQQFERFRTLSAKSHSRELEAAFELARMHRDLNALDVDQVLKDVLASEDSHAADTYRQVRCLRGWQLMVRNEIDAAHAEWDAVANEHPDYAQPLIYRARWMVTSDPKGAIEWYDKAAEREPANPQIYWGKGECYRRLGDKDRSVANLRRALSLDPDNIDALRLMGVALNAAGKPAEALVYLDQAIARAPRYVDFYLSRAVSHFGLDQLAAAVADYDKILQLDPTHQTALFFRARYLSKIDGQMPAALEAINAFCSKFPDEPIGHFERGTMLHADSQFAEAIDACTRAIELKPDLAGAYAKRGTSHLRLMRVDECAADYARAYEYDPNDVEIGILHETLLRAKGKSEDALKVIDHLLIANDDFAVLHQHRAETLMRLERDEEALAAILRALELKPNDADYLAGCASSYGRLGKFVEAVDYCDKALTIDPHDGATYSLRATCRAHLDFDDPRIAQDYERAVDLFPEEFSVHLLRARYLLEKYEYGEALKETEATITLAPYIGEGFALRARARFHYQDVLRGELPEDQDMDPEAEDAADRANVADLERALELGYMDDDIYGELAGHLQELREDDRAMEYIDKGLAANPDYGMCLTWRANIRRRRGDQEGATADIKRVEQIVEARRRER